MMMSKKAPRSALVLRIALLSTLLWLTACSTFFGKYGVFRGRGGDYLQAAPIKVITIPEGVESAPLQPLYRVPEVQSQDEFGDVVTLREYKVPRPLPMGDKSEVGVKIQKLGEQSWVYLNASTAQVWPRTQYFLTQYNLHVARSNASKGIIETEWLQFSDNKDKALRFQVTLQKGIHADTTEVHVLHMESKPDAVVADGSMPWPTVSDDPARESWLLEELANTLAETVDNNAASLLGQNVGGELKAGFTRFQNEPALELRLSSRRAWATVAHSANKEGFKVWESSQEKGVLYIGYAPYDEDGEGFFSKLAFWSEGDSLPESVPFGLADILANLANEEEVKTLFSNVDGAGFSAEPLKKASGYILVLQIDGARTLVNIRDYRGKRLPEDIAKDFLRLLRKNLI